MPTKKKKKNEEDIFSLESLVNMTNISDEQYFSQISNRLESLVKARNESRKMQSLIPKFSDNVRLDIFNKVRLK